MITSPGETRQSMSEFTLGRHALAVWQSDSASPVVQIQCCFTSTETIRSNRDGEPRTATSSFTQVLSSESYCAIYLYHVIFSLLQGQNGGWGEVGEVGGGGRWALNQLRGELQVS